MSEDIRKLLMKFSKGNTDEAATYLDITFLLLGAPGINEFLMGVLKSHFDLPDAIRKEEVGAIHRRIKHYCEEDRLRRNENQLVPTSNIVESPTAIVPIVPPVNIKTQVPKATSVPVAAKAVRQTEAKHAEPKKNSEPSLEKPNYSTTQQDPFKNNRLPAAPIEKVAVKKDPPNTIRKVFRSEHPKVVLRGRDLYNKVDVTRLKLIKRQVTANTETRYRLENSSGDFKLVLWFTPTNLQSTVFEALMP